MSSDLHTHTTFSDGTITPQDLVIAAKQVGLSYLAITDHDTVDGIKELYETGYYPAKGINIIPGVEFSASHPTQDIHILGYNIDIYDIELLDKLSQVAEKRWERFSKTIAILQELGYKITETEVLAIAGTSKAISRSHIARILVKKGYFGSVRETFNAILKTGKKAYVPYYRLEIDEIIACIKKAGGAPVLAHPKLIYDDELAEDICRRGIEGVECFYPQHTEEDTNKYLQMAEKHHLFVTGGSDFHGIAARYPEHLGIFTIDDELAEKLFRPLNVL